MYTVIQIDENGDTFYLNHSCMSSLSFGSEDMAWLTEDKEKAELMLYKCQDKAEHLGGAYTEMKVIELY